MGQKIARIIGLGSYLPERVFTNEEFDVETSDEWIVSRTGIKERRIASVEEFTTDMGYKAAKNALERTGLSPNDLDLILVATMSPDYLSSSCAAIIQDKLGADGVPAFDMQAACSGFIYALSTAKAYIESGMYKNVLVVASEKMSTYIDYTDRSTCVLFGDGAAAAILSDEGKGLAVKSVILGADGSSAELIVVPAGGVRNPSSAETVSNRMHYFKMEGKEVFKHAVRRMDAAAKKCLADTGLTDADISWFVPHQANIRIIDAVSKGFSIPEERIYKTVHKYGNTSASSIPIALKELVDTHPLQEGENILLVAFGAGFTWGGALLTQVN